MGPRTNTEMVRDRRSLASTDMSEAFERGVVIVSIDTEQIWGYVDCLNEAQFEARFPNAPDAHTQLLDRVCAAGVTATWFVVGGLALDDSLPVSAWFGHGQTRPPVRPGKIHGSSTLCNSLWYCRPFLERLRDACPTQEIGLHGGLTHLVWTGARSTRETIRRELIGGIHALAQLGIRPLSFSYPRNLEAHYDLLREHGLQSYRGIPPSLAWRLGRTIPGALLRAWEEVRRSSPPAVWPLETLPGLWTIPASMFFYPIGPLQARLTGLRSRVQRFGLGLEAAARQRAVFHFCFHPENLVESPSGFGLFEDILEKLAAARSRGDIEIMTMRDVVRRVTEKQVYDLPEQQQYSELLETDWRR